MTERYDVNYELRESLPKRTIVIQQPRLFHGLVDLVASLDEVLEEHLKTEGAPGEHASCHPSPYNEGGQVCYVCGHPSG